MFIQTHAIIPANYSHDSVSRSKCYGRAEKPPTKPRFRRAVIALSAIALVTPIITAPAQARNVAEQQIKMAIFQTDGNSNPFLSAGPEVGWNAGLEGLRPLGSPLYRLWDMKVAWRDVNPAPGVFDWSILDRRIAQTEAWGGKPLMVLGLTPQWAASDPNAGDPRWGAGTASAPASIDSWRSYVRALVQRYGDRIGAYETWNEANLQTFWQGSAAELAVMVSVANQEIKAGSSATVLLPSVTTRLASGHKFTQALLKAFGDNPENFFDAFSIHTYPTGSAGATYKDNCLVTTSPFDCIDTLDPRAAAAQRFDDIRTWQQKVVDQVGAASPVLDKGLWDTEVNYGLAGPGINPPVDWSDAQGAELISYTYADSRALGIDATFWYEFTAAPYDLLGVQLTPQTPLTQAAYSALPLTPTGTSGQNPTEVSVGGCVIQPTMRCPGAKLRGLDVSGLSFLGVDLTNTDLRGANLNNSGFGNAGSTDSKFSDANLRDVSAVDADFRRANFSGADLRDANLRYAYFSFADLSDADLRNANLRDADLRGADLTNADFRGADLRGAWLGNSPVRGAKFRGADLRGATMYTYFTRNANLEGARR